mgnify:FL=1
MSGRGILKSLRKTTKKVVNLRVVLLKLKWDPRSRVQINPGKITGSWTHGESW